MKESEARMSKNARRNYVLSDPSKDVERPATIVETVVGIACGLIIFGLGCFASAYIFLNLMQLRNWRYLIALIVIACSLYASMYIMEVVRLPKRRQERD